MPKRDGRFALLFYVLIPLLAGCSVPTRDAGRASAADDKADLAALEAEMARVAVRRAWGDRYFRNSVVQAAMVDGTDLFVSVFNGVERAYELHCINATTGVNRWMVGGLPAPFEFPPSAGDEFVVGLLKGGDSMVVVRRRNGARPFSMTAPVGQVPTAAAVSSDSTVYLTSLVDDRLHALNPANGFSGWAARTEGTINSGPLVTPRLPRRLVVVGTTRGEVVAFPPSPWTDNEPAEPAWKRELYGEVSGPMSLASRAAGSGIEVSILVPSEDKGLYCLDAASGESRWVHRTSFPFTGKPSAHNGRVYARNKERFFVLDLATGEPVWEQGRGEGLLAYEKAGWALAGDGERAYLAGGSKRVTRFRGADGSVEASASLDSFDMLVDSGDANLLIGLTRDGHIVAFH